MKTPQLLRVVYVCLVFAAALSGAAPTAVHAQVAAASGGILESAQTAVVRTPAVSVPLPARGVFTFPAPYSTRGVRLTNGADCGGTDCVTSVGYSYWRNMNNHVGSRQILIALTLNRSKGGSGPTLFSYDKTTGDTRNMGPLFPESSALSWATGEGWYFSATMPYALYLNSGSQMLRYDVTTRAFTTVVDITDFLGPGRSIWQMHSSNDDAVHSFTVRDTNGSVIYGCGVYFERQRQFRLFPARGEFDECQIDKSGRYLVIKENADGLYAEDNVIEDLATGGEMFLPDQAGALGHSDLGFGYGVGEDNWNAAPGAVRVWEYTTGAVTNGRVVFQATDWAFGANHIAHSDAQAGLPLAQQVVCSSNAGRRALPHANEILCYRLDGSQNVLVVAPVMTNLDASGGGPSDYDKEPKGNLDVTGEYFLWTSNMGGARQDAFIVQVPRQLLVASATVPTAPPPATPPATPPAAPPPAASLVPTPITWVNQVNVTVSGTRLTKTRGCGGCADAGATSSQQLVSGDGYVEFVVADPRGNRVVGLSRGNAGTSAEEILFGLRINNGIAEVRERGAYRADTRVAAGDRLRVQVTTGRVTYLRNGAEFYRSQTAPVYPLLVDSSFNDVGATVNDAVLAIPSGIAAPSPTAQSGSTSAPAFWSGLLNAAATENGLQKAGGCDGCPDAGAVSVRAIESGNARLEFTAAGSGLRFVGLGPNPAPGVGMDLPFALRLTSGVAEVREYGNYATEVAVAATDVLSIAIVDGRVEYARNGAVFYTSRIGAMYPLRAGAALYTAGAVVSTPAWQTP